MDDDSDVVDVASITRYLNRGSLDEDLLAQLELEEDVEEEFEKIEMQLVEALKQKDETHLKLAKAVKRMLSKGFTLDEIADDLDLSLDEVNNLAKI